ncbi:hypothetical protein N7532_009237 [Penicillium argentinense]|uniref:N-acetyltransferase domain-containing protein n=1 Tax=Penicillium argentinense TaxID=1131581 RepID=A0A9W9K2E4_9EURO|nr:uncharacterized protein N7532_009237 [Penicillium argentinense]KAJ5090553.1 hypothetical protein N7532_009237 [Penicillium argentinense]
MNYLRQNPIIGADGFTVALIRVLPDQTTQARRLCEVVATGSVKDFGDGDVASYAKNLGGREWANTRKTVEVKDAPVTRHLSKKESVSKYEVTAFAVSPHCQSGGLGARVLDEIKWLLRDDAPGQDLGISFPMLVTCLMILG